MAYNQFWMEKDNVVHVSAPRWIQPGLQRFAFVLFMAILVLLASTVWPTLYRYEKVSIGPSTFPIRVNRFTGFTEVFRGIRWEPQEGSGRHVRTDPVPTDQLAKLTGNAGLTSWGTFSGKVYNGSDWVVRELVVSVWAR